MSYIEKSKRFRQQHFYNKAYAQRTVTLHEELLSYIAARDEEAVAKQMHSALQRIADELIELLEQSPKGKS